jgi:hypothetical protein
VNFWLFLAATQEMLSGIADQEDGMSGRWGKRNSEPPLLLLRLLLSLVFTVCPAFAWGEELYSMEAVTPRASAHFPRSLVGAVRPQGFRVFTHSDNAKTVICEIFWARTTAAGEAPPRESSKALYGRLKPGALVGVIHFLVTERYVREYRSQIFKPGYYTMRYAVTPEGVTEVGPVDFVLLSPVSADRNPAQTVPLDELARRARLATRGGRPAMMSLVEIDADQSFPSLTTDDEGTCVLQVKLRMKATKSVPGNELPLALVVVTAIPEDLGD